MLKIIKDNVMCNTKFFSVLPSIHPIGTTQIEVDQGSEVHGILYTHGQVHLIISEGCESAIVTRTFIVKAAGSSVDSHEKYLGCFCAPDGNIRGVFEEKY